MTSCAVSCGLEYLSPPALASGDKKMLKTYAWSKHRRHTKEERRGKGEEEEEGGGGGGGRGGGVGVHQTKLKFR